MVLLVKMFEMAWSMPVETWADLQDLSAREGQVGHVCCGCVMLLEEGEGIYGVGKRQRT